MSDTTTINSDAYWDTRFTEDWEQFDGPAQSRFFAALAVANMPAWFLRRVRQEALTVADWGCAQGDGTAVLAAQVNDGCLSGIDFSQVAIEQASKRHPSIRFVHADWLDGPGVGDQIHDVVFSSNTLEHFHDPHAVLARLCAHARKAIVLALPYGESEAERIDEHFASFFPENLPAGLSNGFRLAWSKVVDCRSLPNSLWNGDQIILIFAEPGWERSQQLRLADVRVETESTKELNLALTQRDQVSSEKIAALAERDAAMEHRDAAVAALAAQTNAAAQRDAALAAQTNAAAQRDAALADLDAARALIQRMTTSRSWRLTRPMRFAVRLLRHGLTPQDRQQVVTRLRRAYLMLPLPQAVDRTIRSAYRRLRNRAGRLSILALSDSNVFKAPQERPVPNAGKVPDYLVWGVIDWHFRHQRPQHLAQCLSASGRRVFYVSANLHDDPRPGFQVERLDQEGRLYQVKLHLARAPSIYAVAPDAAALAQLRASVGELLDWADTAATVSMVQHPYWHDLASVLPRNRMIYDCMDHHEGFGNNTSEILQLEQTLLAGAELTIATSSWLEKIVAPKARRCVVIRNAGEFSHFAGTPARIFRDPQGRKILGYMGAIAEWFDLDLVDAMAVRFPDCLILLVGNDSVGAQARLKQHVNVQFMGEVPYADLPYYVHGFDVCLLPFKIIPLTLATNPVKIYEYLGAGKPVVAVDLPEMAQFGDLVEVGATHGTFLDGVTRALRVAGGGAAADIQRRQAFASAQTWVHRATDLIAAAEAPAQAGIASVIVVTYNNIDLTKACLESLDRFSGYPAMEVIVVDNASSDGSPLYLQSWVESGPDRKLVLNSDNRGFAAANNQGLAIARGEYLVLLNNDTHVTPGWLGSLAGHLQRDPQIGLVGPVTNNIGNEAKIDIHYDDMAQMIRRSAGFTRRHAGVTFDIRTAAFFCVMMPRKVYEDVGPLDEIFGRGFFEDDDYCRRVEQKGLKVVCAEDVFIHHQLSASFNKLKAADRQVLFEQNKATYEAKWGKWEPHAYARVRESAQHQAPPSAVAVSAFAGQQYVTGSCSICGQAGRFFYADVALWRESLNCEHCLATSRYRSIARGILRGIYDMAGVQGASLSALGQARQGQRLRVYDTQPPFYYLTCAYPLPDLLKASGWIDVELSQYRPDLKPGQAIKRGVTNQNLECLTFADSSLDIVITSDVMEHVRLDGLAHREIHRVLKIGGVYVFTVPHNHMTQETLTRVQVNDPADPSRDVHLLEPEYHGDTNSGDNSGVLSYRVYGLDLDAYLTELGFEVDYSHEDLPQYGILNTELYYCRKVRA